MRLFRSIEDEHGVDDPHYRPPPSTPDHEFEPDDAHNSPMQSVINPVGVWLAVVGGALLALSSFLPLDEPASTFARVQNNTLIQQGGWWFILAGAAIALVAVTTKRRAVVILLSLVAGALVVHFGTDKSLRTLYPIGTGGEPDSSASGTVVPLGIAIYVAGAGAFLAFVGGWMMLRTAEPVSAPDDEETKQCPDCAEKILVEARVCKHCGYRFDNETQATTPGDLSS